MERVRFREGPRRAIEDVGGLVFSYQERLFWETAREVLQGFGAVVWCFGADIPGVVEGYEGHRLVGDDARDPDIGIGVICWCRIAVQERCEIFC